MNILIDLGHPAHFYLFKNAMEFFEQNNHKIYWVVRDKDVLINLMKAYNKKFTILTKAQQGKVRLFFELIARDIKLYLYAINKNIDIMIGTSVCITHVSKLLKCKSIVFNEDDASNARSFALLAYPFADKIVTPDALVRDNFGKKHIKYNGYHELAYLHPNHFTPDKNILNKLGIKEGEKFFIIRLVSLQAIHDINQKGISQGMRAKIIELLKPFGKIFITAEGFIEKKFKKYIIPIQPKDIHHALYYSTLFIGDSQTMAIEAAVLGTPAIRCNTFVGRCSVLQELEHKYQLTFGFLPSQFKKMTAKIQELLSIPDLKEQWQTKIEKMLKEKINLSIWIINFLKKEM